MENKAQNVIVPTELMRDKIRTYYRQQQDAKRHNENDLLRFGLGEIQRTIKELDCLTERDVCFLAGRIKRRKHATTEDMYRLSYAFLQGEQNISAFARVPGAIQVLVKELTGNNAVCRISASECFCNLSLGGTEVCEKIATIAGSYLVTYLNSSEERAKRAIVWTLANILATGNKAAITLMQMELLPKLWHLYADDSFQLAADATTDYREDAGNCLRLIALQSRILLRETDRIFLTENFTTKNPTCTASEYHLEILFNCEVIHKDSVFTESQLLYLINYALSNLDQTAVYETLAQRLRILYAVRILANLLSSQASAMSLLLQQLSNVWHTNLAQLLNKLFAVKELSLRRETLWLLNNMLQQQETLGLSTAFLDKLVILVGWQQPEAQCIHPHTYLHM